MFALRGSSWGAGGGGWVASPIGPRLEPAPVSLATDHWPVMVSWRGSQPCAGCSSGRCAASCPAPYSVMPWIVSAARRLAQHCEGEQAEQGGDQGGRRVGPAGAAGVRKGGKRHRGKCRADPRGFALGV